MARKGQIKLPRPNRIIFKWMERLYILCQWQRLVNLCDQIGIFRCWWKKHKELRSEEIWLESYTSHLFKASTTSILLPFKIQRLLCIYLLRISDFLSGCLYHKNMYILHWEASKTCMCCYMAIIYRKAITSQKTAVKRVFLWIRDLFPMLNVKLLKERPFSPKSSRKILFLNPVSKLMELSCTHVWFGFGTLYGNKLNT